MCRRKPVRHPFDLMAASIWRETMYGKWLILAAALIGAGSAEAQGLVGYAGPPVQVYDRPAPPCGPDCIINTLADAVIRVAPLFVKPRCCAQPPTQAAGPPATNGSAAAPAGAAKSA